jgi:hypothetical protein
VILAIDGGLKISADELANSHILFYLFEDFLLLPADFNLAEFISGGLFFQSCL